VLEEFQILQKSLQQRDAEVKESFWRSLREPEVHKPLIILMSLFAFQQLTGIFVVIVFAVQISSEAGIEIDPFMCAVLKKRLQTEFSHPMPCHFLPLLRTTSHLYLRAPIGYLRLIAIFKRLLLLKTNFQL